MLRMRVEIAALREENLLLRKVNTMNGEALREDVGSDGEWWE